MTDKTRRTFTGNFTQQEAMPEAAIQAATAVLQSGRLHRYNLSPGETGEVATLEAEYRDWQGSAYCLALTSGGQAMQIALRACGVKPGDQVLTNAFTLAPVPGAIHAVGGKPVLVEIDDDLCLDLNNLELKIATSDARVLLLSHMRGHLCDMDRLKLICDKASVQIIEDCAHTMGARWNGIPSGNFGAAACFSTQTYKHLNSGEGGFLTTDDPQIAARATIMSGSYMLYERHGAGPDATAFADPRLDMPNCSARMDHLRAAILRPQLPLLEENIRRWNRRYQIVEAVLKDAPGVAVPERPQQEQYVGSSIQFRLPDFSPAQCEALLTAALRRGVELKWFGWPEPNGFTSAHQSWRYVEAQQLPETDRILRGLFDMRLPLTFSEADCQLIGELITEAVTEIQA